MTRVLLTGALGNVGANTLVHLCERGYTTFAFDIENPGNRRTAAQLQKTCDFTPMWGDLRSREAIAEAVNAAQPDAIVHLAAVIAPTAYIVPAVAFDVNVTGTRNLVAAAASLPVAPQFIFASSYSVHGPRNPYRNLPPLTGDTPVDPGDTYGRHKVAGEAMVQASGLPWTILRLPAVMATARGWGQSPEFLEFGFLLPLDRREHVIDSRDAGRAFVHAIHNERAVGRVFDIGGPETDCRITGRTFFDAIAEARGLSFPHSAFRVADPQLDESWYYEDWVDTRESEEVLQYQQHTFADYLLYVRTQNRVTRRLFKLISPLIRRQIVKASPYYGKPPEVSRESMWSLICRTFGLDPDQP